MTVTRGTHYSARERERTAFANPFARLAQAIEAEQDRWFLWLPVLFGAGIALYFALPVEPSVWFASGLALLALALRLLGLTHFMAYVGTGALLAVATGFAATKLRSDHVAAPVLDRQIGPTAVTGWIELVEPRPQRGQRLTVRVVAIEGLDATTTPARVRVRTLAADETLKPGDAIRVPAILSPPPGPALPGGFDFARTAWFQSLGGVGYAREAPTPASIVRSQPWDLRARTAIERVRQMITQRITTALAGESGAIAAALITGERGGISDATNDAFRDSGLLHILSISGLHMVIMAGAVFLSVRFLLSLSPAIALSFPIKKWAATAAALGALAYLLISGASFATVRSYIMISIMYVAVLLDRPAVALRNVALAALIILALFPESLIDVGFQMSFAAVVALVAAYEAIRDRQQRLDDRREPGRWLAVLFFFGGILLTTLIASFAVAPFAAFHFHKSQQYAMLANLIAIPICNVLVMPAALAVLVAMPFGLEAFPLQLMSLGIEGMVWCAYKVAALPGAVGRIPEIPTAAFGLMVAGGLWLCLWRRAWRLAGLMPILFGLLLAPMRNTPDLFVGRDGLVAVRGRDGLLTALAGRNSMFDLARLLEHDGDGRRPQDVAEGKGFRCDWSGCIARVREQRVAVVRHAAALADDCEIADVVVIDRAANDGAKPAGCAQSKLVIDALSVRRNGAHAIQLPGAASDLRTVAGERGVRPWSGSRRAGSGGGQITDFASGFGRTPRSPAIASGDKGRTESGTQSPRAPSDDEP